MNTKLGRFAVAEPLSTLALFHHHDGRELREVDHEPPLPVLDQENLLAQGVHTSKIAPGAADVNALGSCVFNAATAHLSGRLPVVKFLGVAGMGSITDSAGAEEYAIGLYHETTDLTGDPSQEWPPTDCGSSGLFVCQELRRQQVISSYATAHGPTNLVSLLQGGSVIVGQPWFEAWFTPSADGFVDGSGRLGDLQAAMRSGVAGGHETCITAVEELAMLPSGEVDPAETVLRVRNSWGPDWGDQGSYRVHLSTWTMLGSHVDYKQMSQ